MLAGHASGLATTASRLFSALLIWRLQERQEERHEVMGHGWSRACVGTVSCIEKILSREGSEDHERIFLLLLCFGKRGQVDSQFSFGRCDYTGPFRLMTTIPTTPTMTKTAPTARVIYGRV
jgi:hypothetical protein